MKKLILFTLIAFAGLTACKKKGCTDPNANNYNADAQKDDGTCTYDSAAGNDIVVSSNITSNTTWTSDNIYTLASRVTVEPGTTLTIEAGTIIKGQAGTGANATCLIIAKGAQIMAQGTSSNPIIFTTVADEIVQGQIQSPNLDPTLNGLWGGLIVLGDAPISASNPSVQIEGIPASDPNGLYGGSNASDNSGIIQYVSIRHGGANIGEGNEINGLTLGGVGSATTIDHIEIIGNQDDGIEWFGGNVSVSDVVVLNAGDDAIDTDQGWSGTLNNVIVINPGDECFELDGPEGSSLTAHTIENAHVSAGAASGLVDLDDNSLLSLGNMYFFNLTAGQDFDQMPVASADGACTFTGAFEAVIPSGEAVTDYFKDGSDANTSVINAGSNTVGATISEFTGWSWSAVSGALNF